MVVVSCLGLYAYSCYAVLGKSHGVLIPYILPINKSLRVSGIYGQPNLFALVLLTGVLLFVYSYVHNKQFVNCRFSILTYLPLLTVAVTFFLTGSRSGLLAFLASFFILIWLVFRKRYLENDVQKKKIFIRVLSVLIVAFIVAVVLNYWIAASGVRALAEPGNSLDARLVFWLSAILIFLDHPWFGVGLGNYKYFLSQYINQAYDLLGFVQYESMGYTKWAHNELLQLLCECGIFVFLMFVGVLIVYSYQVWQFGRGKCNWEPLKLFSYLFMVPFIVQSMFSWPLRHPALLILFFTFLGLLLSQFKFEVKVFSFWGDYLRRILALAGLVFILFLGYQEFQLRLFADRLRDGNVKTTLSEFERLVHNPYMKFPLLLNMTPRYVQVAMRDQDNDFARKILPYTQELATLQGAHWQWFNLSVLYHVLGDNSGAESAVERAINLWPVEKKYWSFQHYLNMLEASRATGRPLEEFFPIPPGGAVEDLEGLFDFDDRIKVNI